MRCAGIVRMAPGLLAQLVHPVAERVPVDAEPVRGVAPAAAAVEQRRERLEQPRIRGRGAEHACDERLQGGARQAQQQLEGAEILVRGDRPGDGVERGARLEQAAAEAGSRRGTADTDPDSGCRLDELTRQRQGVVLPVGRDEECRPIAA